MRVLVEVKFQRIIDLPDELTEDEIEFCVNEHNHEALWGVEMDEAMSAHDKTGFCSLCAANEDSCVVAIGDEEIEKENRGLLKIYTGYKGKA